MLTNIRIVLVRPRGSGNIGSVARAMKNLGASELAIIGKARTRSFWARAMAVLRAATTIFAKSRSIMRFCFRNWVYASELAATVRGICKAFQLALGTI